MLLCVCVFVCVCACACVCVRACVRVCEVLPYSAAIFGVGISMCVVGRQRARQSQRRSQRVSGINDVA